MYSVGHGETEWKCVCVCVCERERENDKVWEKQWMKQRNNTKECGLTAPPLYDEEKKYRPFKGHNSVV